MNGNEAKSKSKKQINEYTKRELFKLKPHLKENNYIVTLPDQIKQNMKKIITITKNGKVVPQWVKADLQKGEMILNPPKNLKNLDLSVISMDQHGVMVENEIKLKLNLKSAKRLTEQLELKEQTKFIPLDNQLLAEATIQEDYGSNILNRL